MSRVQCPDCASEWEVDTGHGGDMLCPTCMCRISLGPPKAAEAAPPPDAAAPHAPPPQEVVCPRCELHFYPQGKPRRSEAGTRPRILVVEDQEYFRQVASDVLQEHQYEVRTAADSTQAKVALAQDSIDLLVLDLTLGDRDEGRKLLADLSPKPCPILIFTAKDESELYGETWEELKRLGADDLVVKGMQVAESLARKVGELLGRPAEE